MAVTILFYIQLVKHTALLDVHSYNLVMKRGGRLVQIVLALTLSQTKTIDYGLL
jgi:hypothetical protein